MSTSTKIPMVDPALEYQALRAEIDAAVARVLASGRFILGPEGEALELEIATYVGAAHAAGVASGTDALHLALVAAGIGPGDEVVLPAFTFFATAEAVSYTGATPVFADIDAASFNIDPRSIEQCLSTRTRAVIAVHLFGQCAQMDAIAALCTRHDLLLVEDCAQSLGADYGGRRAGAWGDFGCFSFYPTKNLAAAGDAGLVTMREGRYAEALRMLRHHGSRKAYVHERIGWNSRLDELQAAILRVKLKALDRFNAARRKVARAYRERLAGLPLELPLEDGRGTHAWHQFTVRSAKRDALREALERAGVASAVYYPIPLHRQPPYAEANARRSLPAAEAAAASVLSLPMHPLLSDAELERVCGALAAACAP
jgi:dTDP-4-amino-4,6-dideoxygalactose transaminase